LMDFDVMFVEPRFVTKDLLATQALNARLEHCTLRCENEPYNCSYRNVVQKVLV
jgi:hypothetical protein